MVHKIFIGNFSLRNKSIFQLSQLFQILTKQISNAIIKAKTQTLEHC